MDFETYTHCTAVEIGNKTVSRMWTLRRNTQDEFIVKEVYIDNTYQLPNDLSGIVIIDVGANIGAFAAACVDRGAKAVYCFDPQLRLSTKLFPYPVILMPCAVVGENGPPTVGVEETNKYGDVLLTGGYNTFSTKGIARKAFSCVELFEGIFRDHEGERIWLKLDCEGSEYEILASELQWERIEKVFGECHTLINGKFSRDTEPIKYNVDDDTQKRFPIFPSYLSLVNRLDSLGYFVKTEANPVDKHLHLFWTTGRKRSVLPEIYDTHGSQNSIVNAMRYAEELEKKEMLSVTLRNFVISSLKSVAVLTPFRNARKYLSLYFSQLSSLRDLLLENGYSLRLIAAEGDSLDGTRDRIITLAEENNIPLTLVDTTHGHMRWASVEDPVRMKIMSDVMNKALEKVEESDDIVIWIMSDLEWKAENIFSLIQSAENRDFNSDIFAPEVRVKPSDQFYDTWAFRHLDGLRFQANGDYLFTVGTDFIELSSAGSCLVMDRDVALSCRADKNEAVSFCTDARGRGYRIALNVNIQIYHAPKPPYSILWISDAVCISGFARVAHSVFPILSENGIDLEIIALNYWGSPHNFPYTIWPANVSGRDESGTLRLQMLLWNSRPTNQISGKGYDAIVVLDDIWNVPRITEAVRNVTRQIKQSEDGKNVDFSPPPVISWVTIDGKNIKNSDLEETHPAVVTEFGNDQVIALKPNPVIPFGVDCSLFRSLDKQESRSMVVPKEIPENAFIVGYVGTNQLRKNIHLVIESFSQWIYSCYGERPAYLYLCIGQEDSYGCDIETLITYYNLKGKVIINRSLLSDELLVRVYNSFDIFISLSYGEGFGLTALEAMACEIPCVVTDWSGYSSWIPEGYAMKIPCSHTVLTAPLNDKSYVIGGVADKEKVVEALAKLYQYENLREQLGSRGRELAEGMSWERTGQMLVGEIERVIERRAIEKEEPDNSHIFTCSYCGKERDQIIFSEGDMNECFECHERLNRAEEKTNSQDVSVSVFHRDSPGERSFTSDEEIPF